MSQNQPFPRLVSLRLGGIELAFREDPQVNGANLDHLEGALAGLPELKTLTFEEVDFEDGDGRCKGWTLRGLVRIAEQRREAEALDPLARIIVQFGSSSLPGRVVDLARLKHLVDFEVIDRHAKGIYADETIQREWAKSRGL
ncbi:hypothetical protein FRC04_004827 [Tulasnella sp. 424]|nr:hypothetical protein FRC04_004827 [Tulasnella sp. 424]